MFHSSFEDMISGLNAEIADRNAENVSLKEQVAKAKARKASDPEEPEGKEWFEF